MQIFSKSKALKAKQQLKAKTASVVKWDRYHANKAKNAVKPTKTPANTTSKVISIKPYLKNKVMFNGGVA